MHLRNKFEIAEHIPFLGDSGDLWHPHLVFYMCWWGALMRLSLIQG